jgi:beta-glucanase (GH16 family)
MRRPVVVVLLFVVLGGACGEGATRQSDAGGGDSPVADGRSRADLSSDGRIDLDTSADAPDGAADGRQASLDGGAVRDVSAGDLPSEGSADARLSDAAPSSVRRLTFSDEFNGPAVDLSKWNTEPLWGREPIINQELQYYAPDAFVLEGGLLRLKAEKRTMGGQPYTSGIIASFRKFVQQYGYFEMRAKLPKGKGFWPGFWLLPHLYAEGDKEIDIIEHLGHEVNRIHMSFHIKLDGKFNGIGQQWDGPDFTADFHTFGLEWRPGLLVWYIDGVERARLADPTVPSQKMFVLVNLAVGGTWPGPPAADTVFPSYLDIDYVRVYQYDEHDLTPFQISVRDTSATPARVRPGERSLIQTKVETSRELTHANVHVNVYDSSNKLAASRVYEKQRFVARTPREFTLEFLAPANLTPGSYRVAVGVFNWNWSVTHKWEDAAGVLTVTAP